MVWLLAEELYMICAFGARAGDDLGGSSLSQVGMAIIEVGNFFLLDIDDLL